MIGSVIRLLRDPFKQTVARTNAQQAAVCLAHQRRQRQEVDAYFAREPRATGRARERNKPG